MNHTPQARPSSWFGAWSLFKRECHRFMRVFGQTVGAPLVSAMLYFAVFGGALGHRIGPTEGISYLQFLIPGLAAMGIVQHAFQNASSSLIQMRYIGMLPMDLVALPLHPLQVVLAMVGGAMVRGLLVGCVVLLAARIFLPFHIEHVALLVLVSALLAGIFGLVGVLTGLWGKTFDDISLVSNFVLTPLTYLGGVFFSAAMLPQGWQPLATWNPIYHLVGLYRYAILGLQTTDLTLAMGFAVGFMLVLFGVTVWIVRRGWRLKE
ncbi:ABC-2 type transporter [Magnetococcus marinus MC-1]|uniref:Transport permease protein n=1 Tax=Magnetococcus marinus (strain ATCC BAA-1437 / JCM 17883 / MC-1) TaxID=156889 RepID=A0L9Z5_MAGMM|nr:ABC transporter permease [Magnetococcus marinus]ABK44788.1 ABC-2 type transporter [Magnetococcus marinus MC-1]